jgi:hypothetical protein
LILHPSAFVFVLIDAFIAAKIAATFEIHSRASVESEAQLDQTVG